MAAVTPVADAVDNLWPLVADSPAGLFTDFDGTLSPLAPTPDAATIEPAAAEVLGDLAGRIDVVGIVTGRAADDARARVGLPDLLYVGNHGLEHIYRGAHDVHPAGLAAERVMGPALAAIRERLADAAPVTGVLFENKRFSGSIHYRLSEDPLLVGNALATIAADVADAFGLRLSSGKMVFELRPSEPVNKGTAMERLILEHQLATAMFFGDDVTDVDGFRAMHRLAREHGVRTSAIGVLTADTAPSVVENSDLLLDGVDAVVSTMHGLNLRLRSLDIEPSRPARPNSRSGGTG